MGETSGKALLPTVYKPVIFCSCIQHFFLSLFCGKESVTLLTANVSAHPWEAEGEFTEY